MFAFAFLGLMVDGADLMFLSYSLSSLKQEFGLSNVQAGALGSITLAGMAIGGIFGGWAADRFGRVRTVVWTIVLFSVGTAALGFTHDFAQFATFRFIAALGLGAEYVACNTLMAEYAPTGRRTTILGTLQAGWSVGYVVATLLAGWILPAYGWRWLFIISIVPVVMAVLMQRVVPEPPGYLAARAAGAFARRRNNSESESTMQLIFGDPSRRRMFIFWSLTAGFLQFGYYGVNNWMPTYLEKELHLKFSSMTGYMVGTYVAMILGKIVAGWLADRFGRRVIFAFGAFGAAVFLPVIVLYQSPANIVYLMTIFGFLYGIPYGVNATYMTESFETRIRGTAVGGAYNVGRIGAAVAPAVIGYLATDGSIGLGFLVMGGAYFLCGIIPALFIKEKLFDPQK
ncbi:MFS transporter [Paraburkholderia caballeronis]|uniref:MFS transporter, AAHS family, cis,cis-muconate transporter n=1 Tax=Paraburkholderia caballeronis TaxID=416943 RepID=A0A1H7SG28_9BURK|nr:MFS transporter [Paraburkholderia caballeronis]PXW22285.1 AAHS family cis,cis-muconate transporter-like MFS transporter [Paraburkholderia caballeronis]PXW95944.1 AAHS family cis,cis-muconate transporter-like MFS transporter [Paraburkholderia caballeronis]RAJ92310.1 AAHS family cis,cis-muconate transporter-like MFS transporter [Paraburkholderia caballeronis]SEL71433.1 MFS transporter, AAHS family, cis,cis-muconate transporter [Paraburkholderia caballeronis]